MLAQILNGDSYRLSAFALPTFVTASTVLTLGLIVLFREHETRVRVSFFVTTTTAAIWLYGYSLMYCARTAALAAAWTGSPSFLPLFFTSRWRRCGLTIAPDDKSG